VLSGSYYQSLSTSSPHQIWSAAMVVSPLLRGMFGLQSDAAKRTLTFTPHVPADWTSFGIGNVQVGTTKLDLRYSKDPGGISLEVKTSDGASCNLDFQPAVSLRAKVLGVEFNGQRVPFLVEENGIDQHVIARITAAGGSNSLRIRTRDDFGLSYSAILPRMGASSEGLRVISETWTAARDRLAVSVSGLAGGRYVLNVWNGGQITAVEGGRLVKAQNEKTELILELPKKSADVTSYATISIQFESQKQRRTNR